MWLGPAVKLKKIPLAIRDGSIDVQPVTVVRDLGVLIDAELSMREHVSPMAQMCFCHLRRLRFIRRQLVSVLVLSRLDYCNAVLAGLRASTLAPFHRVLHAAARLVLDLRPRDHVSSALRELHWLPIIQRITTSSACWSTSRRSVWRQRTSPTCWHLPLMSRRCPRCVHKGELRRSTHQPSHRHRAFSVAAPRAWNCLPTEPKTATCSLVTF